MPTPLYRKYLALPPDARQRLTDQLGPLNEATAFDLPQEEFTHYACTDAIITGRVHRTLLPMIHQMGLDQIVKIDHDIIPMVCDMMAKGMLVNQPHFETLQEVLTSLMEEKKQLINGMFPLIENVGSDDQVAELLFSQLHLPYLYMTDSGKRPSVDKETLENIEYAHPVVPHILEWRELETLLTTFAIPLLDHARRSPDSRIHPNILLTRQPTGRVATKEPNLLAIPTRTLMGRLIREGFIPTPGYSFISADYSQLELRILAHLSKCKGLIDIFEVGIDPFRATAAVIWGVKPELVPKSDRDVTKNNFYGIIYGITPQGLSMRLMALGLKEWTTKKVEAFLIEFHKLYPEIAIFISQCHAEARATGRIGDMFGRYRYVPQVRSSKSHVREEGLRATQNHPMQSSAAGIMKIGMKKVWDWMKKSVLPHTFWVDLQIHDELLSEAQSHRAEEFGGAVTGLMEGAIQLRAPLKAKFAISNQSWGSIDK